MDGEALEVWKGKDSSLNNDVPDSYYNDVEMQMKSSVTYEIKETFKSRNLLNAVVSSRDNSCTAPSRFEYEKFKETMQNECATVAEYDSCINTYYCDVCQVVTESFAVYQDHLSGEKHNKTVQRNNPDWTVQNSINPVPFQSHMEKLFSSTRGIMNSTAPLSSEKIEIPELGDTYYYSELHDAARLLQSASHLKSGSHHQLQSLKSFDPATLANTSEKINPVAEKEIDEFLKSVIQKYGCRQLNSEMNELDEECSNSSSRKRKILKMCDTKLMNIHRHKKLAFSSMKSTFASFDNSKSDAHCDISDSRMNNEHVSEFNTREKKMRSDSDSDENSLWPHYDSRNESFESVKSTNSHKTSEEAVSSGESIIERKSMNCKSFKNCGFTQGHDAARICKKQEREHFKTKKVKKTVETKTKSRAHPKNKYPSPPLGVNRKKTEDVSVIQRITEHLKYPCVGLDKIIEIQGLSETHYYCELCDLACSYRFVLVHLESFEHRMKCLKMFVPLIYKSYSKYSKHEIENKVNHVLKILEEMFERGKIRVEKEYRNEGEPCSSKREEKQSEHGETRIEKEYLNGGESYSTMRKEKQSEHGKTRIEKEYLNGGDSYSTMRKEKQSEHGKITVEKEYVNEDDTYSSMRKEKQGVTECQHSGKQIQYLFSGGSTTVEQIDRAESEFYNSIHHWDMENHIFTHENSYSTYYNRMKQIAGTSELDFSRNIHYLEMDQQIMSYRNRSFLDYDTNVVPYCPKFYCNVCNAGTSSISSWELHLTGGRHITNSKKARGELPFRRKPVFVPNACARLMNNLDQIKEPIVGLDMMKETQDSDAPGPMYTCSLCHHNTTSVDIIHHILSLKHRIRFLEKIGHPSLHILKERPINDFHLSEIIRNICAEVEAVQGRGYLSVYVRSAEFEYRSYTKSSTRQRRLRRFHSSYI